MIEDLYRTSDFAMICPEELCNGFKIHGKACPNRIVEANIKTGEIKVYCKIHAIFTPDEFYDRDLLTMAERFDELKMEYDKYIKTLDPNAPAYKVPSMLEWYNNVRR